jgi:asparagine synthase (glutamine-hydrolysing)
VIGSLDEQAFIGDGKSKRILRESLGDLIPDAVLRRRDKIGFFTPLSDMLRAESEWVRGLIADDLARSLNLYDCRVPQSCMEGLIRGSGRGDGAHIVWRALAVRLWAEAFNVGPC